MCAPLSSWPLDILGSYKYLLYGPLVAMVVYSRSRKETWQQDQWYHHILILCALRGLIHQLWSSFSNLLFINRRRRIIKDGVGYAQIDKEWHWDNFLILQCWIVSLVCYSFPSLRSLPVWDRRGALVALLLHVVVSEPMFYLVHRAFHRSSYLFDRYHSIHHSSHVPQPFTAGFATPMEHLLLLVVMGIPILGAYLVGCGSIGLIYGYFLLFDSLRCMGHSNVEIFPHGVFKSMPFLRYLLYTPTYHTIHHTEKKSNFCLFMPLFDALGGTLDKKSWKLREEITSRKDDEVPGFVFLVHVVDVVSFLHAPFFFRSFNSMPFSIRPYILVLWPVAFLLMLMMWVFSKTFLISFYNLRGRLHQTWIVPRFGFQYFLPFAKNGINKQIEQAILRADRIGVKVISLAALNKNEALNGGGTLFVNKHRKLRVRVVHGNTLTAACIVYAIPGDVKEVFLTGATSKLGRAIALYLCMKRIRVLMLTVSSERFQNIQNEAPREFMEYLVHASNYQAGQSCKAWIVGKPLSMNEQKWAPRGTHFHQFVVPPVIEFRRDCTYGKLAAMRLPEDVQGLGVCEYTVGRGIVHACHAGGVVHFLEGWENHEVGAIDVHNIDVVWEAAMKHGLRSVSSTSF